MAKDLLKRLQEADGWKVDLTLIKPGEYELNYDGDYYYLSGYGDDFTVGTGVTQATHNLKLLGVKLITPLEDLYRGTEFPDEFRKKSIESAMVNYAWVGSENKPLRVKVTGKTLETPFKDKGWTGNPNADKRISKNDQ